MLLARAAESCPRGDGRHAKVSHILLIPSSRERLDAAPPRHASRIKARENPRGFHGYLVQQAFLVCGMFSVAIVLFNYSTHLASVNSVIPAQTSRCIVCRQHAWWLPGRQPQRNWIKNQ